MSGLVQLVPLAFVLVLHAVYVRLAARVMKTSPVSWSHAFQFAAMVVVLTGVVRLGITYLGGLPMLLGAVLGLAMQLALGTWFFSERALTSDGQPLGRRGAVRLTALATFFLFISLVMFVWGMRMMLPAAAS